MGNQPIEFLPGTSIHTIRRMKSIGIKTFFDLLNYFPLRYGNYSLFSNIKDLQEGEIATIKGKIVKAKNAFTRRRITFQKITLSDGSGEIVLMWFNQVYLMKLFKEGADLAASGEIKRFGKLIVFIPKEYELIAKGKRELLHTGRIVPIYSEKRGLSSRTIREKIFYVINQFLPQEILPQKIITYNDLLSEEEAYRQIHFPKNFDIGKKARERLAFDELFIIMLSAYLVRKNWKKETVGHHFEVNRFKNPINSFIKKLPFTLTLSQKKVLDEITKDLSSSSPMNRFLQGDVGSGKTVVATVACFVACLNSYQSLFMAPTEILAFQHYKTIKKLFGDSKMRLGLLTSSHKIEKDQKDYDLIIGTHALLTENLQFDRIGLVVIDEQHRFGVRQRALLKTKGINPHLLTMTATPIPRTVALTLYGELDMSVIDEMPKGKAQTKTYLVPRKKRSDMYEWIKKKINTEDVQVFIICPLIEESDQETLKSVKAAKKEHEFLSKEVFKDYQVGLLHGRLKGKEKEKIMEYFKNNRYQILVATPVVEVGIDIPNATVMVIEASERYGLAQLHQLRGRVGRGTKESYCLLFTEKESDKIASRLAFFSKTTTGAKLAQYDLQHRGPGELYGTKQHGIFDLKIATLSDYQLIEKARDAVSYIAHHFEETSLQEELQRRLQNYRIHQITRD